MESSENKFLILSLFILFLSQDYTESDEEDELKVFYSSSSM